MKMIFISCLIVLSINVYAQRISFDSLMKLQKQNPIELEDFLLGIGFKPENQYGDIGNFDTYVFSKNRNSETNYLSVSKYVYEGKNIKTSITTLLQTEYTYYKNEAVKKGFKYVQTDKDHDVVTHIYGVGNFEIEFITFNTPNGIMYSIIFIDKFNNDYYYSKNKNL